MAFNPQFGFGFDLNQDFDQPGDPSSSPAFSFQQSSSQLPSPRTNSPNGYLQTDQQYWDLLSDLDCNQALLISLQSQVPASPGTKETRQHLEATISMIRSHLTLYGMNFNESANSSPPKSQVEPPPPPPPPPTHVSTKYNNSLQVPNSASIQSASPMMSRKRSHQENGDGSDISPPKETKSRRTSDDSNSAVLWPFGVSEAGPSSANMPKDEPDYIMSDHEYALALQQNEQNDWDEFGFEQIIPFGQTSDSFTNPFMPKLEPKPSNSSRFNASARPSRTSQTSATFQCQPSGKLNQGVEVIDLLDDEDDNDLDLVFSRAGINLEPAGSSRIKAKKQSRWMPGGFPFDDNPIYGMPGNDAEIQYLGRHMSSMSNSHVKHEYNPDGRFDYGQVKHTVKNEVKIEYSDLFGRDVMVLDDGAESGASDYSNPEPDYHYGINHGLDRRMLSYNGHLGWGIDDKTEEKAIKGLLKSLENDIEQEPPENREPTPKQLKINLMEHQKVGFKWMKDRESGMAKGGILADDMGLGKTVQMIALMVDRPSEDQNRKTNLIVGPVSLLRQWKLEIESKIKPIYALSVIIFHGSRKKGTTFEDLKKYDVVLTSYGVLATEFKKLDQHEKRNEEWLDAPPLREDEIPFLHSQSLWYRIVLDEAQYIKNHSTLSSRAVARLHSIYRWCLSGTPAQNSANEFYPHIRFLRLAPYNDRNNFQQVFGIPLKKSNEMALQKLHALVKVMLLRRTKASTLDGKPIITLKPKHVNIAHAVFDDDQLAYYQALESKTALAFNKYLKAGTVTKEYATILTWLLRLRQAACHPHLINDFGVPVDPLKEGNEELLKMLKEFSLEVIAMVKEAGKASPDDELGLGTGAIFECPVCYEPTVNPRIIVKCGHDICSECLTKLINQHNAQADAAGVEAAQAKCPQCRGVLDPNRTVDHATFKAFHFPDKVDEKLLEATAAAEVEEDDSNTDSDVSSEDGDEGSDLNDFIVVDSNVSSNDGTSDNDDDPFRMPGEGKWKVKKPKKSKESKSKRKGTEVTKTSYFDGNDYEDDEDDEFLRDDGSNEYKEFVKRKKAKEAAVRAKAADDFRDDGKNVGKGKGKASDKSNKPLKGRGKKPRKKLPRSQKPKKVAVTMAEKRREAFRTKGGKKKFLKKLAKDWITSAKVDKTMEIIQDIQQNRSGEKTLIFSQFTSFLDLLEVPLMRAGINSQRYDGSMSAVDRDEAVMDFQDESKNISVMLISLKAGNAGLNLVAANHVILMDPFWNGFVESQAIDRAHRIGQQKEVHVHRMIVQGTIEDRILELQEKKRQEIEAALDEGARAGISRLGQNELGFLFGLNALDGAPRAEPQQMFVGRDLNADAPFGGRYSY